MLKILTNKTIEIKSIIDKIDFNNKKNLQIISNLFRETYYGILSDQELEYFLIKGIEEILKFNEYSFVNVKKKNEINIFDILIEQKEYLKLGNEKNSFNGNLFNYKDLMNINQTLRFVHIYDFNGQEIRGRGKQKVAIELSIILQNNLFLQLFRSLFVINGEITGVFNLRFFNKNEIIRLAKEGSELWNIIVPRLEQKNIINYFTEKVDGQLLIIYPYNGYTILQSKGSMIILDEIIEKKKKDTGIFGMLQDFYKKTLYLDLSFLNNIIQKNNKIYHFEFVKDNNPIVQEYNDNSLGLFLLGARDIDNGLFSSIKYDKDYIFDYNNLYNSFYGPLIEVMDINSPEDVLIHKLEISDNFYDIENKVKEKRKTLGINKDDYIIEGFIESFNFLKTKVKGGKYFLAKIFSKFSYKRIDKEIKHIKTIVYSENNFDKLLKIFNNSFNKLKENGENKLDMKYLDGDIKKKFKNDYRLIKFFTYLGKYYSLDEIYEILELGIEDKEIIVEKYKEYLVYYIFTEITKTLLSDNEEIAEINELLGINEYLDLNSETIISDLRNYLLEIVADQEYLVDKNNLFLNNLYELKKYILTK